MASSKRALAALIGAVALPAGSAGAATIIIDQFIAPQYVVSLAAPGDVSLSEASAPSAIGGYRELSVTNASNRLNGTSLATGDGIADFSNAARTTGFGSITWNGFGSTGLGGFDVTDAGTNDAVLFDVLFSDANVDLSFSLVDTSGRTSTYSYLVQEALSGSDPVVFSFADFKGDADFTSIDSVSLTLTGLAQGADTSLDLLYFGSTLTEVPLPASGLLLGAALLGAGLIRRRGA